MIPIDSPPAVPRIERALWFFAMWLARARAWLLRRGRGEEVQIRFITWIADEDE